MSDQLFSVLHGIDRDF